MWFVASAVAAPVFVSEEPKAARLAAQAWRLATECAGVEAPAADSVTIEIGDPGGGFAGKAHVAGDGTRTWRDRSGNVVRTEVVPGVGLERIRVQVVDGRTIAHEVAHAWSTNGPPALVEGGADLMAACISRKRPHVFPPPQRAELVEPVDLRAWTNPDDAAPDVRRTGYAASYRMFRALAGVVPERGLWRRGWTWESFDALLLAEGGALGEQLVALLHADAATQIAALSDADEDGLVSLEEAARGTDPEAWDTDGDGWWDGAPDTLGPGAIPLPRPDTLVCSGQRAGKRGARVSVQGGTPYGDEEPTLLADMRHIDGGAIPPHASILLESARPGWGAVTGIGLVPDDRCWSGGRWTVVAGKDTEHALPAFAAALLQADLAAEALLGPDASPSLVQLGDPRPAQARTIRIPYSTVPRGWLEDPAYAAALLVAGERLTHGPREPALREALARQLVPTAPAAPVVAQKLAHVEAWSAAVAACPGGWSTLVKGRCGRALEDPDGDGVPGAPAPQVEEQGEQEEPEEEEALEADQAGLAAVQLGADRLPVCAGWAAGAQGGRVVVQGGKGRTDGPRPHLYAAGRPARGEEGTFDVPAGASLLLAASTTDAGWGAVHGSGLVPDTRCWSDERWTVLALPGQEAELAPFVEALRQADARADALLDPPPHRLLVLLGDQGTGLHHRYTSVRTGWLEGDLAYVAAYAVASERLRAAPVTRDAPAEVGLYEALARALVPSSKGALLAALDEGDVAPWTAAVRACAGGWRAYAAGTCGGLRP